MKFRMSKSKFLGGMLSFIVAFNVCLSTAFSFVYPLHDAAETGNLAEVKRLVSSGSDVNSLDHMGLNVLFRAIMGGRYNVVQYLITEGKADPNFGYAIAPGMGPVSKWYAIHFYPLTQASSIGRTDIMACLIEHGADVNAGREFGFTILDAALGKRGLSAHSRESIGFLRDNGAEEFARK